MKLICHRANLNGPEKYIENSPSQIDKCINLGYDVEIDIRYQDSFYLGHDTPDYAINLEWILSRNKHLWIHCKDINSLNFFSSNSHLDLNYFYHNNDNYTLTSKNIIWTYPGQKVKERCVVVMPEIEQKFDFSYSNCYGICTDYVQRIKL